MKKFQQLLADQSRNEYGLQYKPIKGRKQFVKQQSTCSQNHSIQNPQSVQVYFKSTDKKSMKINVEKKSKLEKIKQTIEEKLSIPFEDQIIYLNGKEISLYNSVTLNPKQILHVSSKKNIVGFGDTVLVNVKVTAPDQLQINGKSFQFRLKGLSKVGGLVGLIQQQIKVGQSQTSYQINFLQSGRILNKAQSFTQNLVPKANEILCMITQNQIQTKFTNEFQQVDKQRQFNYKRIESEHGQKSQPVKKPQQSHSALNFKKSTMGTINFLLSKQKQNANVRQDKKPIHSTSEYNTRSSQGEYTRPTVTKRKSESDALASSVSGFKKKKHYVEDYDSDDSHLIRKIVVNRSKEELEKLLSENSLREEINETEEEKKSVVSSSSEQEQQREKQYIPIRQQKQQRHCPLIPQRKMAQNEKIKINMQLQKLFGLEPKVTSTQAERVQRNSSGPLHPSRQDETTRSRIVVRNANMRGSISSKESIMRALADRKPNRYAEENMYEGD